MDNVTFLEVTNPTSGDVTEHAIIDRGNDEYTSMPKTEYDRRQAEQVEHLTEIPTPDEA